MVTLWHILSAGQMVKGEGLISFSVWANPGHCPMFYLPCHGTSSGSYTGVISR